MAKPIADNVAGHKTRYELIATGNKGEDIGKVYIGAEAGGDTRADGFQELEVIRIVMGDDLAGASVVDIGCGIGRLTQFFVDEPIRDYLGLDILPAILDEARKTAKADPRFSFELPNGFVIPKQDASVDVVVGFASVTTSMMDEEMFEYMEETYRTLRRGGAAIFSFLDVGNEYRLKEFLTHARSVRKGQGLGDVLRWFSKDYLTCLAKGAGFYRVEVIDGDAHIPFTGKPSPLLSLPKEESFQFGQSLLVLRR
jgi:ubiquinone/menaquinone biosynthesis C-methylase UbiE